LNADTNSPTFFMAYRKARYSCKRH